MSDTDQDDAELAVPEVVAFPAQIDVTDSAHMGAKLFGACRPGAGVVIADLSLAEFCHSSAIRYLVAAHNQAVMFGVNLRVVIPSADILRQIQLVGADRILQIHRSLTEALRC